MKKVYLDYNIWDEISKKAKTKAFFQSLPEVEYYLSVAHFEEIHHARKNENEKYKGCSNELKNIMLSMSITGLITYSTSISFDSNPESLNSAIQSIKVEHDTQNLIAKISETAFKKRDEKTKVGFKGIEGIKAEELYIHIWDDPIIIDKIQKYNANADSILSSIRNGKINIFNAINTLPEEWRREYGSDANACSLAYRYKKAESKEIKNGCYDEIKVDCVCLQTVIAALNDFLVDRGFYRDKNLRTYISGNYDLQHFILSTYCDVFVSKDKHFCERAKAIAYYLGIPIEVKLWKNGQII